MEKTESSQVGLDSYFFKIRITQAVFFCPCFKFLETQGFDKSSYSKSQKYQTHFVELTEGIMGEM